MSRRFALSVEDAAHNLSGDGSGYLIPSLSRDELRTIRVALVSEQARAASHIADCQLDGHEQEAAHYRAEHARFSALLDRLPTLRQFGE